jgi:adenine-specific DNA-methyltransferase
MKNAFIQLETPADNCIFVGRVTDHVDSINELKKQPPPADTSALEAEIDQMVYQLYGLTEEEIGIIENGVK